MNPSFAIVDWEDDTSSVISLTAITKPRIEYEEYSPGQKVQAKFHGQPYNCTILKIGGSKNLLEKKLDQLIQSRNADTETVSSPRAEPTLSRVNSSPPKTTRVPATNSKKRPAQRKSKEEIEKQKDQEQRKRARVLGEIQNFQDTENEDVSRSTVGMKSPKSVFVHAACVKCSSLQQRLDKCSADLEERDDLIQTLQQEIRSLRTTLQHTKEKVKESRGQMAENDSEPKAKMVEIIPGSGLKVPEVSIFEVSRKQSSTAKARFLLNCFLTSDEIIDRGSVKAVGRTLINSIALYASNPDKQGDFARCKAAIRSKITSTISKFKTQYGEPTNEDVPSQDDFKTPEFCESDSDSD